ncbi:MAG: DHH family phosphoesterase [Deltaproteobacteria bacterium]|nr:DHH family phosphoesterase [Deltaproteobacteria bacterium]
MEVLERPGPLVILPHDNPDPDALASAAALRFIAKQLADKEAAIALGGYVGRAENRAMVRYLSIPLVPVADLPLSAPETIIALVDTQPGRRNNSLPADARASIVIDHHPQYTRSGALPFSDLRDGYGATSTILTEYVMDPRLHVDTKTATALFYGIMAETQDLGREATTPDMDACSFLYPHTNKRRLAKIENARVPREYFSAFRTAIQSAMIYDRAVVSNLGEIRYPDMVAEMADFLLRLDEVDWAAAIGEYHGYLYVSLRTTHRDVNAGDVLQQVLGSDHAGGHDMIAGGRLALPAGADRAEVAARVRGRLIAAVGMPQALPTRLCQ